MKTKNLLSLLLSLLPLAAIAEQSVVPSRVGVHLGSYHTSPGFNNVNPGVYLVWSKDEEATGVVVGSYYNSERNQSSYAGYSWSHRVSPTVSVAAIVGVITGYKVGKLLLVLPSVAYDVTDNVVVRTSFVPKIHKNGSNVLHLSVEYKF